MYIPNKLYVLSGFIFTHRVIFLYKSMRHDYVLFIGHLFALPSTLCLLLAFCFVIVLLTLLLNLTIVLSI